MIQFARALAFNFMLQAEPLTFSGANRSAKTALNLFAEAVGQYMYNRRLSFVNVMDYAAGDPAEAKVRQALRSFCHRHCDFEHVQVPDFDTVAAGFTAHCLINQPRTHIAHDTVMYINVAPIYHASQVGNGEHDFLAVLLNNGRIVFAPHAGRNLYYLLPYAVAVLKINFEGEAEVHPQGHKGQFRSWWHFSQSIARIMRGDFSKVVSAWRRSEKDIFEGGPENFKIPESPETILAGTDNFGNLRFNIHTGSPEVVQFEAGQRIAILLDGEQGCEAVYFPEGEQPQGTLLIRPGSNIVERPEGRGVFEYLDGFVIGGHAAGLLGEGLSLGKKVSFAQLS